MSSRVAGVPGSQGVLANKQDKHTVGVGWQINTIYGLKMGAGSMFGFSNIVLGMIEWVRLGPFGSLSGTDMLYPLGTLTISTSGIGTTDYTDGQYDTLMGGSNSDELVGGSGIDHLFGNAGDDLIVSVENPGNENDLIDGGRGIDRLFSESGGAGVSIEEILASIV